jgi:DNA polymerase-3 subunit delta'
MPFRDVIGHRRIVELLERSIAHGTLPPSLIFAGPSGVGKRLVAIATAQALNCSGHGDSRLATCDSRLPCPSCSRIARGVHPDVILIEPGESGSIRIEAVRDVIDRANYRPFEGRTRVVIIDEADAMVPAAQNALLKTLEEPPPSSVFLLVTSRPDVLLATVRSRCPRLTFRPLPPEDIAEALVRRGRPAAEARAIAATADGSLGRALEASGDDQLAVRAIAQQVLARVASTPDARRRVETAKDLLGKTGKGGASDREQLASHLLAMASILRDVEVIATGADAKVVANADLGPALDRLTAAYRGDRGVRAFQAIDQALVALDRNVGVKVVADWLVLQL